MSDPRTPEGYTLIDATDVTFGHAPVTRNDPNSVTAEPADIPITEAIRRGIELLSRNGDAPTDEFLAVGRQITIERMARGTPLGLRDNLIAAAAMFGIDREVIDAQPPPPPRVEVPPPTVREGRAIEKRRQKRQAQAKMRTRRKGDRAGRPL